MSKILITSAVRTPIGKLGGALSAFPAHRLGQIAIAEAMRRAQVQPSEISEVIMGQVLTAGAGQNPARQAAIGAGIPHEATAFGINQVCGSGLRAVALGYQSLLLGDAEIMVAGGQENMSLAPHIVNLRAGVKLGDTNLADTVIRDGLWDAFNGYHMGQTAENIAARWKISRTEQDEFAYHSQRKAGAAQASGRFRDEIVTVAIASRNGETLVENDEALRADTTPEALAKLRPAFLNKGGTVTAGNSSGIHDGAAALVLERRKARLHSRLERNHDRARDGEALCGAPSRRRGRNRVVAAQPDRRCPRAATRQSNQRKSHTKAPWLYLRATVP
jgi:acetyl-CoA C-acetyltransferase